MVLQIVAGAAYQLVQGSWTAATFLIWPVLGAHLGLAFSSDRLDLHGVSETLSEYSRDTVAGIVAAGVAFAAFAPGAEPPLLFASELLALSYFAFLFWKF